jgi:hypothetical protein
MQQIQVLDHQKSVGISEDSSLVYGNQNDATTAMLQTKTSAGTIAITQQNLQAESSTAICVDSQLDLLTLHQVDESEMRESFVNGPSDKKVQLSSGNKSNIKLKKDLSGRERARLEECQVFPRKPFDWEGLRSQFEVKSDGRRRRSTGKEEDPSAARNSMNEDGVDWEAVRLADVEVIAEVIKERGFNWILAGRIKVSVFIFCLL